MKSLAQMMALYETLLDDQHRMRRNILALREGLFETHRQMEAVQAESEHLRARNDSLERQVMILASESPERVWDNVSFFVEYINDDDDPHAA